jgi:hypothetical protein
MENNSKGVLIYAFNTTFDYVSAAIFAAKQVKQYLNLPVTLVTDSPIDSNVFDKIIILTDKETSDRMYRTHTGELINIEWLNKNRVSAYDVSPYDKTLLIDADYFMFNSSLRPMFETDIEFACFNEINDVTGNEKNLIRISQTSIPMQWATVVYFTKCEFAKSVFNFMSHIKNNWDYYSLLYRFRSGTYRNDFSLSVAVQSLSGYTTKIATLPGKLQTMFSTVDIVKVENNEVVFSHGSDINKIKDTNIHCMNKLSLEKFYG